MKLLGRAADSNARARTVAGKGTPHTPRLKVTSGRSATATSALVTATACGVLWTSTQIASLAPASSGDSPSPLDSSWAAQHQEPIDVHAFIAALRAADPASVAEEFAPLGRRSDCRWTEPLAALPTDTALTVLGAAAIDETDPLRKAVLTHGLFGHGDRARASEPGSIPLLLALIWHYGSEANDPFGVGIDLITRLASACLAQGVDFASTSLPLLEASDNDSMIPLGFLLIEPNTAELRDHVAGLVLEHPTVEVRYGAFECLRIGLHEDPRHAPWLTGVYARALERETAPHLQCLLGEALVDLGTNEALAALFDQLPALPAALRRGLLEFVLGERTSSTAQSLVAGLLLDDRVEPTLAIELAAAFGSPNSTRALAELVLDEGAPVELRRSALLGLWRGPDWRLGQALAQQVAGIDHAPTGLRTLALHLAFFGSLAGADTALDPVPFVAAEQPPELRALALGLVMYTPSIADLASIGGSSSEGEVPESFDSLVALAGTWARSGPIREPGVVVGARASERSWTVAELQGQVDLWASMAIEGSDPVALHARRKAARFEALRASIDQLRSAGED